MKEEFIEDKLNKNFFYNIGLGVEDELLEDYYFENLLEEINEEPNDQNTNKEEFEKQIKERFMKVQKIDLLVNDINILSNTLLSDILLYGDLNQHSEKIKYLIENKVI